MLTTKAKALAWVAIAYVVAAVVAWRVGAWFGHGHPLGVAFAADLAATITIFVFSFAFDNSSFYDAYWSVAPLPITVYWALADETSGADALRRVLVLTVIGVWGCRLTYNWIRGWTGLDHEDWRYVNLRGRTGSLYWPVSLAGLHLMPTLWVFGGLLPVWPAVAVGNRPLNWLDAFATVVTVGAIWIEARADRELVQFRRSNHKPEDVLATGLWALSRHPNYFGEMAFWWGLFLFGVAASPAHAWTGIGALAITAMFRFASLPMIEARMLERRPRYAERQKNTPLVVPWPRITGSR